MKMIQKVATFTILHLHAKSSTLATRGLLMLNNMAFFTGWPIWQKLVFVSTTDVHEECDRS